MWFFVFSINFARTREGRPARRKLTELLVKSKKTLVTEPAAIFFVFQVNISCKTTSIILYFKYASFSVVTRKKRQNTNPHPDGNFFDDRFGLGILRDVQSDHKPLEAIMTKPLSQAPPRIQRLLIRLQKYNLTVQFVPGKLMFIADTLSRAYLKETVEDQLDLNEDIEVMVHSFTQEIPASPERLVQLKEETAIDETLQALKAQIAEGFPTHRKALKPILAPYWNIRNELSEAEGLLFKGRQLIIPRSMQSSVLNLIHESHLGIEKCKARARSIVYWPGMSRDIHDTVAKCATCLTHRHKNQKEPMIPHAIPARPWQKLGSDVFEHKGKPYLVVVDYYSKFIETSLMRDKTAGTIVTHMKSNFARHGIPEELISDNMPYNSKEFKQFANDWGFKLTTSSPTYPQANGLSEKAVQTVKRILKKTSDPYIGLLDYRNTPVTGMTYSPAQLLMSRASRTKIPVSQELLEPKLATKVKQQLEACQQNQAHYYNQGAKPLTAVKPQEVVRLRQGTTWIPALVNEKAETPRSYLVTTATGQQYRRDRKDFVADWRISVCYISPRRTRLKSHHGNSNQTSNCPISRHINRRQVSNFPC